MWHRRAGEFSILTAALVLAALVVTTVMPSTSSRASEDRQPPAAEPGYFGTLLQVVDEDVAQSFGLDGARGVLVARVIDGGPAQQAGIREGDIILAVDGDPIADRQAFIRHIRSTRPGKRVQTTVFRDREEIVIDVTVGRRPESLTQR
jgi:serine protease Do